MYRNPIIFYASIFHGTEFFFSHIALEYFTVIRNDFKYTLDLKCSFIPNSLFYKHFNSDNRANTQHTHF